MKVYYTFYKFIDKSAGKFRGLATLHFSEINLTCIFNIDQENLTKITKDDALEFLKTKAKNEIANNKLVFIPKDGSPCYLSKLMVKENGSFSDEKGNVIDNNMKKIMPLIDLEGLKVTFKRTGALIKLIRVYPYRINQPILAENTYTKHRFYLSSVSEIIF